MRDLTSKEINGLLAECDWGTLLMIDGEKPYGIEISHFVHQGAIYFIFNPDGKAARCIDKNPNVAYKVCRADLSKQQWVAAMVEGRIEKITDAQKIYDSFLMLAERLHRDREKYKKLGQMFSSGSKKTPVHRLPIQNISGKASS